MFADSSSHECHAKHVFCFFMCYDTSPRMARFYWLLTFLLCSIALFFVSHAVARAWGFSHQFGVVLHLVPLFFIVLGHVPLIGLRYEDLSARDPDSSCDPVMMRVLTVTVVVMIGVAFAGSITLDKWWSDPMTEDEFVHGKGPEHASPSATVKPESNALVKLFGSPSHTPTHTPTPSPDPKKLRLQFQESSDHRATVGAFYMSSVGCAAATVVMDYMLRTLPEF